MWRKFHQAKSQGICRSAFSLKALVGVVALPVLACTDLWQSSAQGPFLSSATFETWQWWWSSLSCTPPWLLCCPISLIHLRKTVETPLPISTLGWSNCFGSSCCLFWAEEPFVYISPGNDTQSNGSYGDVFLSLHYCAWVWVLGQWVWLPQILIVCPPPTPRLTVLSCNPQWERSFPKIILGFIALLKRKKFNGCGLLKK